MKKETTAKNETTAQFVARINKKTGKHNGLRRRASQIRHRH